MDNFDATIIGIISSYGGKATTHQIIKGLSETEFATKRKFRVIERLRVLQKFGYLSIEEGEIGDHGGRKPLFYELLEE